jgi:pyruvyltransferase
MLDATHRSERIQERRLRAYWWRFPVSARGRVALARSEQEENFGDALVLPLLERISGVTADWAAPRDAELISIGSILSHVPDGWEGTVVGAGLLGRRARADVSHARILALRGALTARRIRWRKDVALGDPGLLVPFLIEPVSPRYELGLVPHWSDGALPMRFAGRVIRPLSVDPLHVVREIASCQAVISSSLHGVVVADAFGIPCRPERFDGMSQEGGDFKFRDYASALGMRPTFGRMREAPASRVERAQAALLDAFRAV